MKTLVNKNNPAIRITASGIEFVHSTPIDYWRVREVGCYAANAWELKEEETIVKTIKEFAEKGKRCMQQAVEVKDQENYIFWDGFHNCAENILREVAEPTEGIKGNLEGIPSNVDLEKDVESWFFNEISSKINVENTMYHYFQECAHRYYNLGLNARKEK